MKHIQPVLTRYAEIARPLILGNFREDSCIASTRVTVEVLGRLGIKARPLPVRFVTVNEAQFQRMQEIGRWPTAEEYAQWKEETPEVWSVGIDETPGRRPDGYPGHLVAIAGPYLIDASASQFSRPAKGIHLPDVLVLDHGGELDRGLLRINPAGGMIFYGTLQNPPEYKSAPDWRERSRTADIIQQIVQELREHLRGGREEGRG
jgi:hypothetical protein